MVTTVKLPETHLEFTYDENGVDHAVVLGKVNYLSKSARRAMRICGKIILIRDKYGENGRWVLIACKSKKLKRAKRLGFVAPDQQALLDTLVNDDTELKISALNFNRKTQGWAAIIRSEDGEAYPLETFYKLIPAKYRPKADITATFTKSNPRKKPVAHMRRGHVHRYWVGPKSEPAKRKLIERWVEPCIVGA